MAATTQNYQENIPMAAFKTKSKQQEGLTRIAPSDGRKTLQTLQYSAVKDRKSLSKDALLNSQKEKSGKNSVQVYVDPQTPDTKNKTFDDKYVQTEEKSKCGDDIDQEAYDLMVNEDIPETYWRDLAERRREALDESLHENEQLHNEIEELREENEKLSKMASQADYFAGVIQELVGIGQENTEEKEDIEEGSDKNPEEECVCDRDSTDNESEKESIDEETYKLEKQEPKQEDKTNETTVDNPEIKLENS